MERIKWMIENSIPSMDSENTTLLSPIGKRSEIYHLALLNQLNLSKSLKTFSGN